MSDKLAKKIRRRAGGALRVLSPAGRTAVGRTTVHVLAINEPLHLQTRRELIAEGMFDLSAAYPHRPAAG